MLHWLPRPIGERMIIIKKLNGKHSHCWTEFTAILFVGLNNRNCHFIFILFYAFICMAA